MCIIDLNEPYNGRSLLECSPVPVFLGLSFLREAKYDFPGSFLHMYIHVSTLRIQRDVWISAKCFCDVSDLDNDLWIRMVLSEAMGCETKRQASYACTNPRGSKPEGVTPLCSLWTLAYTHTGWFSAMAAHMQNSCCPTMDCTWLLGQAAVF